MGQSPLVTLGLPVRNGQRTIRSAIEAIVMQTVSDFELIVSDNASTDDTGLICRHFAAQDSRIHYFRHDSNQGAARNFNFTFQQSRGTYFKWCAHDDLLGPTYLQRCLERFNQGPASLVLCYALRQLLTPEGEMPRHLDAQVDLAIRKAACSGWGPTFAELLRRPADEFPMYVFGLIRRDALERTRLLGAFPSADLVLVAELRLLGPFGEVPELLFFQRRHLSDGDWLARSSKGGEAHWYDPNAPWALRRQAGGCLRNMCGAFPVGQFTRGTRHALTWPWAAISPIAYED